MTPQASKVLDFIREDLAAAGMAPTYDQIAAHIGISSKGWVSKIIDSLVEEGKLVRSKTGARGLSLPDAPDLTFVPLSLLKAELARRGVILGALDAKPIPFLGRIRHCADDHCAEGVKPGMMYCRRHWFMIPRDVQDALKAGHAGGDAQAFSEAKVKADDAIARGSRS